MSSEVCEAAALPLAELLALASSQFTPLSTLLNLYLGVKVHYLTCMFINFPQSLLTPGVFSAPGVKVRSLAPVASVAATCSYRNS